MGNPSSPIYGPGEASTMLSKVAALPFYVAPPIVPLCSVVDMLIKGAREIVDVTRNSKSQELVDFGRYVNQMVNQLVSALQNRELGQRSNVRATLDELHRILCTISGQIVRINSGGLLSRLRRLMLSEEKPIPRMRRQLDDALSVFRFAASIDLLSKTSNPQASGLVVDTPEPIQPQVPDSSDSSNASVYNLPPQENLPLRTVEPSQDTSLSTQLTHPRPRPHTQGGSPQRTPVSSAPGPGAGEITAAFMNVEGRRRSFQNNRSRVRMMELATALDRLSVLLDKAGRTREALKASQESAELYRTLAEREH